MATNNVKTVELIFKEDTYIMATDLKIYHARQQSWPGLNRFTNRPHTHITAGYLRDRDFQRPYNGYGNIWDQNPVSYYMSDKYNERKSIYATFDVSN